MSYKVKVTIPEEKLDEIVVETLSKDYDWLDLNNEEMKAFRIVLRFYMTREQYEDWYEDSH